MMKSFVCIAIWLLGATSVWGAKMTYEEAKRRLPKRELPAFWIADVEAIPARWAKLKRGHVKQIATSPGGRPIHLITYGKRESVESEANFNSAVAARKPSAYMNKAFRSRPVVYFVGPVHGQETEGLVGLVNLIHVMETGKDLRGRDQSALRRLGRQCRLLIIPVANPDGMARYEPRTAYGLTRDEMAFWGMGTWRNDEIAYWPTSKTPHPRVGSKVGFLGCYFNDKGINPMHDEFFEPMGPEAPAILRVARQEGPDLAVSLHMHESAPALLRPAYVPIEVQQTVRSLSERYGALLDQHGLPHAKPFTPGPEKGNPPSPFNLVSAIYHTSGAVAFTFESPGGVADEKACHVNLEQILDIQLLLYEAMLRFALEAKRLTATPPSARPGASAAAAPTLRVGGSCCLLPASPVDRKV